MDNLITLCPLYLEFLSKSQDLWPARGFSFWLLWSCKDWASLGRWDIWKILKTRTEPTLECVYVLQKRGMQDAWPGLGFGFKHLSKLLYLEWSPPWLTYHSDILSDILILSGILPRIYSDILPGMPHSIRSWRYGRVQAPCTASGPRHKARTRSCPKSWQAGRSKRRRRWTRTKEENEEEEKRKKEEEKYLCWKLETLTWQVGNKRKK